MHGRIVVCLAALTFAAPLFAGITIIHHDQPNRLSVDGVKLEGEYEVTAPTVRVKDGEYLTYDGTGKSLGVTGVVHELEPEYDWSFVEVKRYDRSTGRNRTEAGVTFKLRAAKGPLKGMYLTRSKDGKLSLTADAKKAARLDFLELRVGTEYRDARFPRKR